MGRYGLLLLCGLGCVLAMGAGCPPTTPADRIVFSSTRDGADLNSGVYAMNPDGSHVAVLSTLPNAGTTISTKGSMMVLAARAAAATAATSIWRVNLDGTGSVQLTDGSGWDSGPLITFDGSRVVFQSEAGNLEVRSVLLDGSGLVNLSNNAGEDFLPAVRPGSSQVAFTSRRDGNSEIYVVDQAGGAAANLTNTPGADDSEAVYSPDGARIAFLSNRDGDQEVYIMNADGTGQANVSNHAGNDFGAQFSPNGMKISYISGTTAGHFEVWVADVATGTTLRLTDQLDMAHERSWGPNSTQVGFVSTHGGRPDVYVINTDGTGQTNLTHDPAGAYGPLWSPDGKTLFFETNRDGNWEVYRMNPDGSGQTNLTNNAADDRLRLVATP